MQEDYRILCEAVERKAGKAMKIPSDFEWLSDKIEARTKDCVSASTLMRLWGYRKGVTPRQATLDVLARYVGCDDYVTFTHSPAPDDDESSSDEIISRCLRTEELQAGQRLVLSWYPDRRCLVVLREDGNFEILEAEKTKLNVGDIFHCDLFIENEPLYMRLLGHDRGQGTMYVAGKKNGIRFSLVS